LAPTPRGCLAALRRFEQPRGAIQLGSLSTWPLLALRQVHRLCSGPALHQGPAQLPSCPAAAAATAYQQYHDLMGTDFESDSALHRKPLYGTITCGEELDIQWSRRLESLRLSRSAAKRVRTQSQGTVDKTSMDRSETKRRSGPVTGTLFLNNISPSPHACMAGPKLEDSRLHTLRIYRSHHTLQTKLTPL
jgi:hypothetical protein